MIGIYRIKNLINNKCYYGSSKDIIKRKKQHYYNLNKNKHNNTILQNAWNKYGQNNFIFEIIEECALEELHIYEQKYLNTNPYYNIAKIALGGDNLTHNPNRIHIIEKIKNTLITKYNNMSKIDKQLKFGKILDNNPNWKNGISKYYCLICKKQISYGSKCCMNCLNRNNINNPFYGKKHKEETKIKLSQRRKGKKPTNIKPFIIDNKKYLSLYDAQKELNISYSTIQYRLNSKNIKFKNYTYI